MKRKRLWIAFVWVVCLAPAFAFGEPLNILWIVADDMSPDVGAYGDAYAHTPNIDALAAEGARYTRAFSVHGQCSPSRSALITGMYPTAIGTHHMRNQGLPPVGVKCFTEYLRAAGYYCVNVGKTDYNLGNGDGVTSGVVQAPLGAWDENSRQGHWRNRPDDAPFFAVFNLGTTHESRLHLNDDRFEQVVANVPEELRHDPDEANLPAYYPDDPVFRSDWAKYYDMVTALDLQVGDLLDQLDADGLRDSTVVFFFGDHGRPLPRAKRWLYDSGLRVPLIIRWPGELVPDSVDDRLVSFIDFGPTVLSIAEVAIPDIVQGVPFLGKSTGRPRDYVFATRDRTDEVTDRARAVRDTRYKYIRNYRPDLAYATPIEYMDRMPSMQRWRELNAAGELSGPPALFFGPRPAEELYDTAADPDEVHNLAGSSKHEATLAHFRGVLARWETETGDLGTIPEGELLEQWRPGGAWSTTADPIAQPAGGAFDETVEVSVDCATPGSTVVYTLESGADARWSLYHEPITIHPPAVLRVQAGRLGFRDSAIQSFTFARTD